MREQGRGIDFRPHGLRVPIVSQAIIFDLGRGSNNEWGRFAPYRDLGYAAACAVAQDFALGSVGAGMGATTATAKGGLGSASTVTRSGHSVAAIAVVNAVGSTTIGDGPGPAKTRFVVLLAAVMSQVAIPLPMPASRLTTRPSCH